MKKWGVLILLVAMVTFIGGCEAEPKATVIEPNPRLDDLMFFVEELESNHKALYTNISKSDFGDEVDKIAKLTPEMSDAEFYYHLRTLLSLVGDAHTSLYYNNPYEFLHALGFAVDTFEDGWHVVIIESKNSAHLGAKLLAINDVPIEDVYERAKAIISYENESWLKNQFSNTINFKEALEFLEVVPADKSVVLTLENDQGKVSDLELEAYDLDGVQNMKLAYASPKVLGRTSPSSYYSAFELEEDAYYIQYNRCEEAPNLTMKDFATHVSEALSQKSYTKVIIDLRYNFGGNSNVFAPMLTALSGLQKELGFEVYTLIGRNTFSSAVINAVQIDQSLENTFVGQPTGSNVNHFGEIRSFKLNNQPIEVYYSTKYFELIKGYEGDSINPDILVENTYQDFIGGYDKAVEWVLDRTDQ